MGKRKTEDIFEIDGRKFILTKFDPLMGNYILLKICSYALPFGISEKLQGKLGVKLDITSLQKISRFDFIELQKDVLSTVYEQLPGNRTPLINDNGSYGITDFSMMLSIQLLIASLAFNFSDFFGEEGLNKLLEEASDSPLASSLM